MTTSGYQLRRLTTPGVEPVTVAQLRQWLNLDDDIEDDEVLEELIGTAREHAEEQTKRCFVESTYELALDEWTTTRNDTEIRIPIAPVLSVVSINTLQQDGSYVLLDPSFYAVALDDEPPRIVFSSTWAAWPTGWWGYSRPRGMVIELRCGYPPAGSPADAANVPKRIKTAIKLLAAHWYENREAVATETRQVPVELPIGVSALLDPFRRLV